MSDAFGDWEPADSLDREPPAPEQVTYRLHRLRIEVDALAGAAELPTWDELDVEERTIAMSMGATIVAYIVSRGPTVDPGDVARHLHGARRYVATMRLPAWDDLDPGDRRIGIEMMAVIVAWLREEGAL